MYYRKTNNLQVRLINRTHFLRACPYCGYLGSLQILAFFAITDISDIHFIRRSQGCRLRFRPLPKGRTFATRKSIRSAINPTQLNIQDHCTLANVSFPKLPRSRFATCFFRLRQNVNTHAANFPALTSLNFGHKLLLIHSASRE